VFPRISPRREARLQGFRAQCKLLSEARPCCQTQWPETAAIAEESPHYKKWLEILLAPGSSLGGARPKAIILDAKNPPWIAKFPGRNACLYTSKTR